MGVDVTYPSSQSGYVGGRPELSWWTSQIRKGIEWRKKMAYESHWQRWENYYNNDFTSNVLPVNLFFRMVRTVVPRVYFRNPSITVRPTKPGTENAAFAQLVERLDNQMMRKMKFKQQIKRMTQHAWFFGTGVGKLGYGTVAGPTIVPGVNSEFRGSRDERVEYNSQIRPDMPWFGATHPGRFILPAGTEDFEDARWCAIWIQRPVWDIQQDKRFKNTQGLTATRSTDLTTSLRGNLADRPDVLDLLEVRDKKFGRVFVFAPFNSDRVLYDSTEWQDFLQRNGRMGYYHLNFNPRNNCAWGLPDSKILEPQQLELNEVRTLQMKHRRLAILKLMYKRNTLTAEQLEKLLNGEVMAGVEVTGELSDIEVMKLAEIPNSLFAMDQTIMSDVREGMGFSRNQFGNYAEGSADRTAYEARIVQEAMEIRIDERRDMIADLIVDVFEDANEIMFERWDASQIVQVVGPYGVPVWVEFRPSVIQNQGFDLEINPDSSLPETKEMREQKAFQMYAVLKDNPLIDEYMLTKMFLRSMHGVQFDTLVKAVFERAAQGMLGATADRPMSTEQYMQSLMQPASMGFAPMGGESSASALLSGA